MKILLDTQVWLWMQAEPERLSPATQAFLVDPNNALVLSAASGWEVAIKYALGKLPLPLPPAEYVPDRLSRGGVEVLPIQLIHGLEVAALPPHHRDPFDRILIAQALVEDIPILTADRQFHAYSVKVIRADTAASADFSL